MKWTVRAGLVVAAFWSLAAFARGASSTEASRTSQEKASHEEVISTGPQAHPFTGISVLLGGGIEGYTGSLAPRIAPGPTYGVGIALRPTDIFGLEFDYSGAVHELRTDRTSGLDVSNGADVVRNGGRALVTLGLTDTIVQPYLLGGVGFDHYDVRGRADQFGYRNDTSGVIPLGGGVHGQMGAFTVDLRGEYVLPFDQQFAPGVGSTPVGNVRTSKAGQYQGTLRIGARF